MSLLRILSIYVFAVLMVACSGKSEPQSAKDVSAETEAVPDMHTSQIAVDWNGSYKGILPCADCEGIEMVLRLNTNLSYELSTHYVGRSTDDNRVREEGQFEWDKSGSIITLGNNKDYQFKVGENKLFKLDRDGKIITGDLKDKYILTKFSAH